MLPAKTQLAKFLLAVKELPSTNAMSGILLHITCQIAISVCFGFQYLLSWKEELFQIKDMR